MGHSRQVQALIDGGLDVKNEFEFSRLFYERAFEIYYTVDYRPASDTTIYNYYFTINRKIVYGSIVVFVKKCTEISKVIEISKEDFANVNLNKCARRIHL